MDVAAHLEVFILIKLSELINLEITFRNEYIVEEAKCHKDSISSAVFNFAGDQASDFRSKDDISEYDISV